MTQPNQKSVDHQSRRKFLKRGGALAAGSALAGLDVPKVHAAEENTIRLALIGCGGRGSGAVGNALEMSDGPIQLYAMADLFENRLESSYKALKDRYQDRIAVEPERQFAGFDAFRHAIDSLRPGSGDVALLTAYSYIRPTHLAYAVERGVHVFMEKPFAPDPGGLHRMLRAGEEADKKNLKIAAGLMCRHSVARQALIRKIRDGELGDVQLVRAYRMGRGSQLRQRKPDQNELEWQIKNRVHFHWGGSGWLIEMMIHQIDECCWIKDAWPVAAHGLGGRSPDNRSCGQNLDTYAIEYTFADGSVALVNSRAVPRCYNDFSTYVHGSTKAAQFSGNIHAATVHTYQDRRVEKSKIDWKADKEPSTPWQAEWKVLLENIRNDKPHNETKRAVYADFASIMGRAAVHTGKIVTWDEVMDSNYQFCPQVDALNFDSQAPVLADAQGNYPIPVPGQWAEV